MLKFLHLLFPGLHQYRREHVSLVLESGIIMPVKQAVCACGDTQPLGTVNLHKPELYDPTAGTVETPDGPGRFVSYDPSREIVTVEHDLTHLVDYPADRCFVTLEGCRSCLSS